MSTAVQERPRAPEEGEALQTVPTVAKFLSLSRSKIYQLMDSGELPYIKIGSSRRVRWSDVYKLVDRSVVARTP